MLPRRVGAERGERGIDDLPHDLATARIEIAQCPLALAGRYVVEGIGLGPRIPVSAHPHKSLVVERRAGHTRIFAEAGVSIKPIACDGECTALLHRQRQPAFVACSLIVG